MAVFNFGGKSVDSSDADAFVKAVQDADNVTFGGSIVAGNSYGVTGGTVTGDVNVGHDDDQQ